MNIKVQTYPEEEQEVSQCKTQRRSHWSRLKCDEKKCEKREEKQMFEEETEDLHSIESKVDPASSEDTTSSNSSA